MVFIDQHGSVHSTGTGVFAEVDDGAQGVAFIEDVVDDQHVTVDERDFGFGFPEQIAASGFVAIACCVQVGRFQREIQMSQQLARENQAAIHHAEHNRVAFGQFGIDLRADAGNGSIHFGLGVQAVGFAHDLTDMLEISGHDALQVRQFEKSGQRYASVQARASDSGLTLRVSCKSRERRSSVTILHVL
ncbi:hypothetical protein ALQ88_01947 [Pseudomonas savastanoi]|nr:hypothetical protein ALQ88_01947 [Pseudomonas savastanoi]